MLRLGLSAIAETSRKLLASTPSVEIEQIRTTFILKRRWAPSLHKKGRPPRSLKPKNYVYDLVENTEVKKRENMEVLLTTFIEGLGMKGDVVSVRPNYAREKLLLPGLAVYPSPENLAKYKEGQELSEETQRYSSRFAPLAIKELSKLILNVPLNKENPWTLEKFHVRSAFRRAGYWVPDEAFELPQKPVTGPDMSLENRDILIKLTVNDLETTHVRCRIHHWSTELKNRLPYKLFYWLEPTPPVFEEDKAIIEQLPQPTDMTKKAKAKAR